MLAFMLASLLAGCGASVRGKNQLVTDDVTALQGRGVELVHFGALGRAGSLRPGCR